MVDLVLIALSPPFLIGVYEDGVLIEEIKEEGRTSEHLPPVFARLLDTYEIKTICFARGPGSFMSIKIAYLFLKTLSITKNIELLAADGFYFNNNSPIKAHKNSYFVKEKGEIKIKHLNIPAQERPEGAGFALPKKLIREDFGHEVAPLYVLPAV